MPRRENELSNLRISRETIYVRRSATPRYRWRLQC
jgi:hypothetical protein